MSASQNPFGLHTVTPYLVVEDVAALLDFLQTVFGATIRGDIHMRDDGSVKHAEVQVGDSVIMMGEPMDGIDAMPSTLYLYVDDCDVTYREAIDAGATSVIEPAVYPHGDRYGGVRDTNGNIWWVVTHVGRSDP